MKDLKNRTHLIALLMLLALFAGCKGETPTAPPVSGPPGSGPGGGTPPVGATVTLTVSNPNPLTNSNTTITARVTQNNQNVPNGTAVEFGTTLGSFTESTGSDPRTIIRTTQDGQATVTLTSSSAGTANVTAVVNNVIARTSVTFAAAPTTPPPSDTAPAITGVTPSNGRPEGGEIITISGRNFRSPVRVFFSIDGRLVEGFVANSTLTSLQVVTPKIDLGTGQTAAATLVALVEAGTPSETRITGSTFTFRKATLTPAVRAVSPTSGPLEGGTRVTIFGDAFESPAQVFFGAAEAQIINVTFNQIVVVSPPARDATPNGSDVLTGPVSIRIKNIASGTEVSSADAFRYSPKVVITAAGPTEGPFTGGTRVTIDGTGFDDPVAVSIGGIAAQPISVTGTRIVAITGAISVEGCADETGPIAVTNINTGDSIVSEIEFTYLVPQPIITNVTGPVSVGQPISVTVVNGFGFPRLRIGDVNLTNIVETVNPDGSSTFTANVPTTLTLDTEDCPGTGVSAEVPTPFDVVYESATTGCTDTLTRGAVILPPPGPQIAVNPVAFTPFTADFTAASVGPPPVPATLAPSAPQTLNIVNVGNTTPLTVISVTQTGAGCTAFAIGTAIPPVDLNTCEPFPITVVYNGADPTPAASVTHSCTLTVATNAGTRTFTLIGTTQ
jgi:hypothetical protein